MNTMNLELRNEIKLLKSFAISILGDGKEEYKKDFVKEILKESSKKPVGRFKNKKDFLNLLQ